MPDIAGLSRRAKCALAILEQYPADGVVTSGATAVYDDQAFVHWRTARALCDRGLAHTVHDGEIVRLGAEPST